MVFAQETQSQSASSGSGMAVAITIDPIYLFNNAIKLDATLQTSKPLAYVVGAELYRGRVGGLYKQYNNYGEPTEDKIAGYGINAGIKYKFEQTERFNSYYISPGITYRRLTIKEVGPMYYSYTENGMEFISYGPSQKDTAINPILLYATVGRYLEVGNVVLDMYFGAGRKLLKQNKELQASRKYHKAMYGYNYSEETFLIGIKLGYQIVR
ncbi:hypothetical protein [Pedobacter sp.]